MTGPGSAQACYLPIYRYIAHADPASNRRFRQRHGEWEPRAIHCQWQQLAIGLGGQVEAPAAAAPALASGGEFPDPSNTGTHAQRVQNGLL